MKISVPSWMAWLSLLACGGSVAAGGSDAASDVTADAEAGAIATIAAGLQCTCAVSTSGTAKCWGSDTDGFCSTYPPDAWSPPIIFQGPPTSVASFALENKLVSHVHNCAVTPMATLYCWGDNQAGELGSGAASGPQPVAVPVPALGLPPVAAASCGDAYTCALTTDGSVYCWGHQQWGELGIGLPDSGIEPQTVTMPTQVALPGPASILAAGPIAACAVVGGEAWCWGGTANGDGSSMTVRYSPVQAQGLTSVTSR
jgi:alpha-tubulin suppressor-like RCC1 family protein